jgi:hypothetical protein
MTDPVKKLMKLTPSFHAQTMMDLSYIYNRPWDEVRKGGHRNAQTNLRNLVPEPKMLDDVYLDLRPARFALLGNGAWVLGCYFISWFALRRRERQ